MRSDISVMRRCAKAMRYGQLMKGKSSGSPGMVYSISNDCDHREILYVNCLPNAGAYCPFHDYGECMKMIMKFNISIGYDACVEPYVSLREPETGKFRLQRFKHYKDLRTAVCLLVAKIGDK